MRTKSVLAAALLAGLLFTLVGFGGSVSGQQAPYTVSVTKAVEGDGPAGPYGINITCTNPFVTPAGPFDFTIEGGETVTNAVNYNDVCTVSETDDLGADSVSYACTDNFEVTCVDDQTIAVDQSDNEASGTITVTNTFDAEPEPEPEPEPEVDVVEATPSFTG